MAEVLDLCDRWDALSKGETTTTRLIREAHARDRARTADFVQQEYAAFREHHSDLGTVDSPVGFAARFREWLTQRGLS